MISINESEIQKKSPKNAPEEWPLTQMASQEMLLGYLSQRIPALSSYVGLVLILSCDIQVF